MTLKQGTAVAIMALQTACGAGGQDSVATQAPGAWSNHIDQATLAAGLDRAIRGLVAEFGLPPGLAVAVIAGDSVLFEGTFGYADVERQIPVTPRTSFYIASVTKSFLAATARFMAAADSTFDLERSLSDALPGFRLDEPLDPAHISMRDLLTHRAGIESREATAVTSYLGPTDDGQVLRLLSRSTPATREFRYTNIGYLLAAEAMEQAAGRSWQDLVRDMTLTPLGMTDTRFSFEGLDGRRLAQPYAVEVDGARLLPTKSTRTMHAAGGMVSTLADMTKWLRVHMNGGRLGESQIFGERMMAEIHSPQAALTGFFGGFRRYAYGLGWYLADYDGLDVVQCFGSYAGYRAHVSFMPEAAVGVVVLQNDGKAGVFLPDHIALTIYDRFIAPDSVAARLESRRAQYHEIIQLIRGEEPTPDLRRAPPPEMAGPNLEHYAGTYEAGEIGSLRITRRDGALHVSWGDLSTFLQYEDDDAFVADFTPGSVEGTHRVRFERSHGGLATAAEVEFGGRYRFARARR